MTSRVPTVLAFDPGDPHVGLARFEKNTWDGWSCVQAWELEPYPAGRYLESMMPFIEVVVIERFQIYPDKALSLIGSECGTSQTIGMIKWIVRSYNGDDTPDLVEIHEQMADIQTPTKGVLRVAGIKSTAKRDKAGDHALSAELHGWHFLFRSGLYDVVAKAV